MKTRHLRLLGGAAVGVLGTGLVALFGAAPGHAATPPEVHTSPATPGKWNWEIRDGKRVPKGQRLTNPDGSWRETVKVGSCTTVKERSPAGEYKEVRSCD